MAAKTNPNGANQFVLDPRQKLCWEYYIDPRSVTFGNAYQSAIKVGYTEDYSRNVTDATWFTEKIRRLNMLSKAENVLDQTLDMPIQTLEWTGRGEEATQIVTTNPALVKIQQDTAKFIAERLGKEAGYATRTENTGKDGAPLIPKHETTVDDIAEIAKKVGEELRKKKEERIKSITP